MPTEGDKVQILRIISVVTRGNEYGVTEAGNVRTGPFCVIAEDEVSWRLRNSSFQLLPGLSVPVRVDRRGRRTPLAG